MEVLHSANPRQHEEENIAMKPETGKNSAAAAPVSVTLTDTARQVLEKRSFKRPAW